MARKEQTTQQSYILNSRQILHEVLEEFGHEYKADSKYNLPYVNDGKGVLLNKIHTLLKKKIKDFELDISSIQYINTKLKINEVYLVEGKNVDTVDVLAVFDSLDKAAAEIERLQTMKRRDYFEYGWNKFQVDQPYFNF